MIEQLQKILGITVRVIDGKEPNGLPFYLTNGRSFNMIRIGETSVLMVTVSADEKFGAVALGKQLTKYMEAFGGPAAFVFPSLSRKQKESLIERGIPFVCLPEQIYLPFLGVFLSNQFRKQKRIELKKMTPSAQVLFLYFLYQVRDQTVVKKKAAEDLHTTRMSISRASEQLLAMKLITQEAHGKELRMKAVRVGKDYYKLALPYLVNPVQKVITLNKTDTVCGLPAAGESALSLHSMLNSPIIPVVAADKGSEILSSAESLDERWESTENLIRVECWKYDPCLFAKGNTVDPVSLAASLQNESDERVQGELLDYLEGVRW